MKNVFIIYIIVQLITSAYGLAVIESVKPIVENKLRDKGYKKNLNSLYTFSTTISDLLKVFIPFYYLVKSFDIIANKGNVDKQVNEYIKNGLYVNDEINSDIQVIDDSISSELDLTEPTIVFEKPEKYTARKNDISLYNTYETPVEYIKREASKEEKLELSPFVSDNNKVVETVVVKSEVSKNDIAKAIGELSVEELELLKSKISDLESYKKDKLGLKLEKEVA